MAGFPSMRWYYEPKEPDLFECPHCQEEYEERDREPETSLCRGCYRFDLMLIDLHRAREKRRAARLTGSHTQPVSQGDTAMSQPIDPRALDVLLGALDPFVAGEVIDALARLGLLPEPPDPDAPIAYTVRDQPPSMAAQVMRLAEAA
jgi:hypothetical protein